MVGPLAKTPTPPYFAVIFTSQRTSDEAGYASMAERMLETASQQPGYLGVESVRGPDGVGITVSYWSTLEAIRAWKEVSEHRAAQELGRSKWYETYRVRVCRVESEYGFQL